MTNNKITSAEKHFFIMNPPFGFGFRFRIETVKLEFGILDFGFWIDGIATLYQ